MSPGMASSWAAPFRTGTAVRWLLALLALAALPVLLHGCHGDEDNELFAPLVRSRPASALTVPAISRCGRRLLTATVSMPFSVNKPAVSLEADSSHVR